MQTIATITSKRQFTIPAALYRKARFSEGEKVIVSLRDDTLEIQSATRRVQKLAGSIRMPKEQKGLSVDQIIARAKREYFFKRKKHI